MALFLDQELVQLLDLVSDYSDHIMINKAKLFSFSKKINGSSSVLFVLLTVGALAWFPSLAMNGIFLIENISECILYIAIYLCISGILYLFIGNRLVSNQIKINSLITSLCIALMIILNGVMIYLYSAQIFMSKSSLYITIPASLLVTLLCVEMWIRISNKDRNKHNNII